MAKPPAIAAWKALALFLDHRLGAVMQSTLGDGAGKEGLGHDGLGLGNECPVRMSM